MTEVLTPPRIVVQALAPAWQAFAEQWAQRLGLPMGEGDADFALQLGDDGLQLLQLGPDSPGPVRVDFLEGATAHRRQFGGGAGR